MDSMEVNKTVAAALVAGIAFFLTGTIGVNLVAEHVPAKSAIKIDVPEASSGGGQPAPAALPPVANLLAKADPGAGEAYAKKICAACHTFTQGAPAGVGPNLYNVVGGPHAHMEGFAYSTALKSKQGPWTYDELNEWLDKPSAYAPGTRMSFAGISNNQERANVIAYLHTLSPNPVPYPPPVAEPPAGAKAAAAGAASTVPGPAGIDTLIASADTQAGEADTKKLGCVACHTFTEGGKNGIGPNLYGVVGGPHAHEKDFSYSTALKGKQGPWTYEELDKWLTNPAAYAPGTRMTFAGIKNPKERADVIGYLRSLSAHPEPLPSK